MLRAAAAVLLMGVGVAQSHHPALAQAQECQNHGELGRCEVELPVVVGNDQSSTGNSDTGAGPGQAGNGGEPVQRPPCRWVTVPPGPEADANLRRLFPEAPPGSALQVRQCDDTGGTQFDWGSRWLPPGTATEPEPPSAQSVALTLYARVKALMQAPVLASNPPAGAPVVVELPVFVEVLNPQSTLTDRECVLGVCVDMTATPVLEFVPGEPESPVVQCSPAGSRFDPAAGDAEVQAAVPGTCAHAYRLRTGVEGRPDEWPGQVTVRWTVMWTSNVGVSGSFPELPLSTPAPRVVNEVQTVVAESS